MAGGGGGGGTAKCCTSFCGFLITAGFVVLIYWAIFQPHHIRATVESATLSNLTVTNAAYPVADVSYHLSVILGLYNPSVHVGIYYDSIGAELRFFHGAVVIGPAANDTSPSAFYQRSRSGGDVKLEFDYGRRPGPGVAVAGDVAGELEQGIKIGAPVSLELHVEARVRYVLKMFKLRQRPRIWCSLSIPVKAEGRRRGFGGTVASGDRCIVKY